MAAQLTCEEAEELLSLAVLGVLDRGASAPLEAHLPGCTSCKESARNFRDVVALLPNALPVAEPSPELRRRLLAQVHTAAPRRRPRFGLGSIWAAIPQSRVFAPLAVGAAAAAVAVGVWGAGRSAPARPSARTFDVVPAGGSALAHGQLTYFPDGKRAVLTVSGIASPPVSGPHSSVYEVWLMPHHGTAVPAAFMSPVPGSGTWTAVISGDVLSYSSVSATIEPSGGTAAPTTPPVFTVALPQQ